MTSHAAVVARGMGKPCVAGVRDLMVHAADGFFDAGGQQVRRGDWITIDGATGRVLLGKVPTVEPAAVGRFPAHHGVGGRASATMGVRTNADTPGDAAKAREFGAEGIGLCRTEHMFFGDETDPGGPRR